MPVYSIGRSAAMRAIFDVCGSVYGSRPGRLRQSGGQAEVIFGEDDEGARTPAERSALGSCPSTRLHLVPDCGHMLINVRSPAGALLTDAPLFPLLDRHAVGNSLIDPQPRFTPTRFVVRNVVADDRR
jgi:hypothetical protein